MDETLRAYLAGCIDCDGTILISRRNKPEIPGRRRPVVHYIGVIGLNQVTPQVPTLLAETFGGRVREYHYASDARRSAWTWQVTNAAAAVAAQAIRPYLRIKTRQADLIIELAERAAKVRKGLPLLPEEREAREALYQHSVSFNALGRRRSYWGTPVPEDLRATPRGQTP